MNKRRLDKITVYSTNLLWIGTYNFVLKYGTGFKYLQVAKCVQGVK